MRCCLPAVASALLVSGLGCGTATLHRAEEPAIDGRIAGSDAHTICIQNRAGRVFAVPDADVVDVDHPKAWAIWGWFLYVVPGVLGMVEYFDSVQRLQNVPCPTDARAVSREERVTPPWETR
ncbi:MAG: hypothetical protein EXR79_09190 [Myxococcales bacterium]|nr:hypothetical protein [Myxococcales bacterium]